MSSQRSVPDLVTLIPPGRSVSYPTGGPVNFTSVHINRVALRQFLHDGRESAAFHFGTHSSSRAQILLNEALLNDRCSQRSFGAVTEAIVLHLLQRDVITLGPILPPALQQKHYLCTGSNRLKLSGNLSLARLAAEVHESRAFYASV